MTASQPVLSLRCLLPTTCPVSYVLCSSASPRSVLIKLLCCYGGTSALLTASQREQVPIGCLGFWEEILLPVSPCSCPAHCLAWCLQAFLAASLKSDEELMGWFKERLIWSDPAVVNDLTKSGLFVRIFAPQVTFTASACAPDRLCTPWCAQNLAGHWQLPTELSTCHQGSFLLLDCGCRQSLATMALASAECILWSSPLRTFGLSWFACCP